MRKRIEKQRTCPICGSVVEDYGDLNKCNFEIMTGRAGWHMSFQPRMEMCGECSDKLLTYIEKWFLFCDKTHIYKKFKECSK